MQLNSDMNLIYVTEKKASYCIQYQFYNLNKFIPNNTVIVKQNQRNF